jgi:hypothetical protein
MLEIFRIEKVKDIRIWSDLAGKAKTHKGF